MNSNRLYLVFNQNYLFQSPTDRAFPFARSAMMQKIARLAYQAIFVGGVGLEPGILGIMFTSENEEVVMGCLEINYHDDVDFHS